MRTVLHIINGEHYSGAERVQDLLALHLPDLGYAVHFASLKAGVFAQHRLSRSTPLSLAGAGGRLRALQSLRRLVNASGCSLVHTHTPRSAMFGSVVAGLEGVPFVHHVHSPTKRCTEKVLRNAVAGGLERLALTRADRLIAVSDALVEYLEGEHVPAARIRRVYNGVPATAAPARQPPGEEWVIGTIALFRPRKGIEVLLRALKVLIAGGTSVTLRAIGAFESAAYQSRILELAERLDLQRHVVWSGFSSNVTEELSALDALVLPSLYGEGLPMVLLEAMAAGVPVVATSVPGVPDVVEHGVSGLLVEPDDVESLAAGIGSLVTGEFSWSALRSGGLAEHARKFSATAMAAGVAGVYDELLGESRARRAVVGL